MTFIRTFGRSLKHAVGGILEVARSEQSFRLQVLISVLVIGLAWLLPLNTWERILVLLLCSAVMVLEILNSIMERLVDALQPRLGLMAGEVKDMMAGAVFVTALLAGVVGIMIFYSHFHLLICAILETCGGR